MSESRGIVVTICMSDEVRLLSQRVARGLGDGGLQVAAANSPDEIRDNAIVILLSSGMNSGLVEVVRRCSRSHRTVVVLGETGTNHLMCPTDLLVSGASDMLIAEQCDVVTELQLRFRRWFEVETLMRNPAVASSAIGSNKLWRDLVGRIVEVASFTGDMILLSGESGTGKELLARLTHDLDRRSNKGRYVILDCTTVVPELSGSEFFGHERGAFTGAIAGREGVFAEADQGTLFLDEIGDLPLPLQAQLLRVMQEGTYRRVGSNVWYRTKFRLICATNKNLHDEVQSGRFRRDLFYRIAQWTFRLPSLGERPDDIIPLARHFLQEDSGKGTQLVFDSVVERFLRSRAYPGNVRELRLLVARLRLLHNGSGVISTGCIPPDEWRNGDCTAPLPPDDSVTSFVRAALSESMGLDQIANLARLEAIKQVMKEELEQAGFDHAKRSLVFKRTAERLKCTLRWIQDRDKTHGISQSLSERYS